MFINTFRLSAESRSTLSQKRKGFPVGNAWVEGVNTAWAGMVENENKGLRDRVSALEHKVALQTDEVTCLRVTLAECLRRLDRMDNQIGPNNDHNPRIPCTAVVNNVHANGSYPVDGPNINQVSKIPQRRPGSATRAKSRGGTPERSIRHIL